MSFIADILSYNDNPVAPSIGSFAMVIINKAKKSV